ncbi:Polyketide cyclase / dehydrase and lipid transport [Caulifigura coniformis]|uniref:Polyketide cyclase / dehydrase and lipid transport n=1 Tax=Caulifigura coniformis TaxID=2527983 RepID=A0A517S8Q7_9PLAN|nr:SRPBCC family protein [Caulifigura coniformis]QDT52499.1 Polyketide cyclase / dehydrase and lipid transport [Caulifigura coniformis]
MATETLPPATETVPRKRSKIKTIVFGVLGCLVLFAGVVLAAASTKPAIFRVERSIVVNAPPEKITPHLTDLRKWTSWSPWEKVDPDMKREYSGAESGVGAKYAWDGDDNIGAGKLEVAEVAPEKVRFQLDFLRPMECSNSVEFLMAPEGDGTKLTWVMAGENTFMGKVAQVFIDVEEMCGSQFNEGLRNLKGLAEATP